MSTNVFPVLGKVSKSDKERLLKQRGMAIWMVGLSGSGKTTLARGLEECLNNQGYLTQMLDGDNLRSGINKDIGFSEEGRTENLRRAAEVAKLFVQCGVITICSFISPTKQSRNMVKDIIGENDFYEVFVNCSVAECEKRDTKGLYKKARKGEIADFTGISSPFEEPQSPFLKINSNEKDVSACISDLIKAFDKKIKLF